MIGDWKAADLRQAAIDLLIAAIGSEKSKPDRSVFVQQPQFRQRLVQPRAARHERGLVRTSFGKQSSKYEYAKRRSQDARLSGQNALGDREAGVAEKADAECCRQNDCKRTDEGSRRCKDRMAAGRQPQQHWKQERNRDDSPPKSLRQKNDEPVQDD